MFKAIKEFFFGKPVEAVDQAPYKVEPAQPAPVSREVEDSAPQAPVQTPPVLVEEVSVAPEPVVEKPAKKTRAKKEPAPKVAKPKAVKPKAPAAMSTKKERKPKVAKASQ